jgi:hypothetical protein
MGVCCCAVVLLSIRHKKDSTRDCHVPQNKIAQKIRAWEMKDREILRRDLPNCYSPNCQGSLQLCRNCSIPLH